MNDERSRTVIAETSGLFEKIHNNALGEIKELFDLKAVDINIGNLITHETPIITAVRFGLDGVAELLLNYNPDLTIKVNKKSIIDYLRSGSQIKKLELKKAILNKYLIQVAKKGDIKEVESVLQFKEIDRNTCDDQKNTALHYAAIHGAIECIKLLPDNFTARNTNQDTPVETATRYEKIEMVKKLLEKQVNGSRILIITLQMKKIAMFEELLTSEYGDGLLKDSKDGPEGLLHEAICSGQDKAVSLIIQKNPRSRDDPYQGVPPLYQAIEEKQVAIIDILAGFNVSFSQQFITMTPHAYALHLANQQIAARLEDLRKAAEGREEYMTKSIDRIVKLTCDHLKLQKRWTFLKEAEHIEIFRQCMHSVVREQTRNDVTLMQSISKSTMQETEVKKIVMHLTKDLQEKGKEIVNDSILGNSLIKDAFIKVIKDSLSKLVFTSPPPLPESVQHHSIAREQEEFINAFETEFDEAFGKFRALCQGELVYAQDAMDLVLQKAKEGAHLIPDISVFNINVPVSTGAGALVTIAQYMRRYYRKKAAERMCHVFSAITPLERACIVHALAESIAFRYQYQLTYLKSGGEGITRFATCAAIRIIDYIISKDDNQIAAKPSILKEFARRIQSWASNKEIASELKEEKSFENLFLDGLARVTNKYDDENNRLGKRDKIDQFWEPKALFENTGIIDEEGRRWASSKCKPLVYGYCYASAFEAEHKRGFTLGDKEKEDLPWPDNGQKCQNIQQTHPRQNYGLDFFSMNNKLSSGSLPVSQLEVRREM